MSTYNKHYYLSHKEKMATYSKAYRLTHLKEAKEYHKLYRQIHKEKKTLYCKAYYRTHKEQFMVRSKNYYQVHKEHLREIHKEYRLAHLKEIKESGKAYRLAHPTDKKYHLAYRLFNREHKKKYFKQYSQTPIGQEVRRKVRAKRKQLGFIPLNSYFKGAEGHHIDKEKVIYIPKELHQKNRHSVLQNRNMEAINNAAFEFLRTNTIQDF